MSAIPTRYDGYQFRSRTEARWAVFFNTIGLKYEYEKEGYLLADGTPYLPDFWIPSLKSWIEIKGAEPTPAEHKKARELALETGHRTYIFTECWYPIARALYVKERKKVYDYSYFNLAESVHYQWPGSYYQGWLTFMIWTKSDVTIECLIESEESNAAMHPLLIAGYEAARGADFGKGKQ